VSLRRIRRGLGGVAEAPGLPGGKLEVAHSGVGAARARARLVLVRVVKEAWAAPMLWGPPVEAPGRAVRTGVRLRALEWSRGARPGSGRNGRGGAACSRWGRLLGGRRHLGSPGRGGLAGCESCRAPFREPAANPVLAGWRCRGAGASGGRLEVVHSGVVAARARSRRGLVMVVTEAWAAPRLLGLRSWRLGEPCASAGAVSCA